MVWFLCTWFGGGKLTLSGVAGDLLKRLGVGFTLGYQINDNISLTTRYMATVNDSAPTDLKMDGFGGQLGQLPRVCEMVLRESEPTTCLSSPCSLPKQDGKLVRPASGMASLATRMRVSNDNFSEFTVPCGVCRANGYARPRDGSHGVGQR